MQQALPQIEVPSQSDYTFDFVKGIVSCENLHFSPCERKRGKKEITMNTRLNK